MEKNKGKIVFILLTILSVFSIGINSYAHSGRTDASGGHKDNQNKSGLGSYHYHCGGHPAHLHPNGVCPYSSSASSSSTKSSTSPSSSSSSKSSTSSSSSSSSNKSITSSSSSSASNNKPTTVEVIEIKINEDIESIEVGESRMLTTTITPSDASDKSVTWKSSDESIATVTSSGTVKAIKPGVVTITATSSNGKTSTLEIDIKEKKENENSTINASKTSGNTITNATTNNDEDSNLLGGIVALGLLGGGSYFGYKKYKKYKKT